MKNNYMKVFMTLVFLVLASYVSYNLVIRRRSSFSGLPTAIFNTEPFQLKNSQQSTTPEDDQVTSDFHSTSNRSRLMPNSDTKTGARIFCVVLTSRDNVNTKGRVVVDSWAHKCDNYKLVSLFPTDIDALQHNYYQSQSTTTTTVTPKTTTVTTSSITNVTNTSSTSVPTKVTSAATAAATTLVEIGDVLQPPGLTQDSYEKLTDKVFLTFKYLYHQHPDYDWYLKADDDTFVFVDNLRTFLADKNSSQPVTYGYDFKVIVEDGYHSGGGGYLLSRASLHRLGSALAKNYSYCDNSGTEDVDVARCLRRLGVKPAHSIDSVGRERFHPLSLSAHFYGFIPDWLYEFAKNPIKRGIFCCSDTSISFHYMSSDEIEKLAYVIDKMKAKTNSTQGQFKQIAKELKL